MSDTDPLQFAPDTYSVAVVTAPGLLLLAAALLAVPRRPPSTVHPLAYAPTVLAGLCAAGYVSWKPHAFRAFGATYTVTADRVTVSGPFVRDREVLLADITDVTVTASFYPAALGEQQSELHLHDEKVGTVAVRHEYGPPLRLTYLAGYLTAQSTLLERAAAAGASVDAGPDDGVPEWARA